MGLKRVRPPGSNGVDVTRILGIDPGLNSTGYGIIDTDRDGFRLIEAGVIRTSVKDGIGKRLLAIYSNLSEIADEYRPTVFAIEKLYAHYRHPTTALLMGHARGVICLVSGQKDVRLVSYPSTRIKKALAGSGHASKKQIGGMVKQLLALKVTPEPDDITDALAVAISHAYIEKNMSLRGGAKPRRSNL